MIKAFVIVIALSVAGDVVVDMLDVPIPGAAIGMMLLATLFTARGGADSESARLFDLAAPHFPLFFVPAAVGVVVSADTLAQSWLHIVVAIMLGTAVTISITGMLTQYLLSVLNKVRAI